MLIEKCIDYCYSIIINKVKQSSLSSKYLESILYAILKMKCVSIVADNEQEGYIIFEILNSRGVPLQMHELIKNYIFMYSRENNGFDVAKNKWDQVIANVDEKKNSSIKKYISQYCVHYFEKEIVGNFCCGAGFDCGGVHYAYKRASDCGAGKKIAYLLCRNRSEKGSYIL